MYKKSEFENFLLFNSQILNLLTVNWGELMRGNTIHKSMEHISLPYDMNIHRFI